MFFFKLKMNICENNAKITISDNLGTALKSSIKRRTDCFNYM